MFNWLRNIFLPHVGNEDYPHFWRKKSIVTFVGIVFLVEIFLFGMSSFVFKSDSYLATVLPSVLTTLTNKERSANEVLPLKINNVLETAAQLKADDMASRGYFAHYSPEGNAPWYWIEKVKYEYLRAGENLAVNFTDSKDVVSAWMKSPTHRANILKGNYEETGIALAEGIYKGKSAVFVVQFFATPKSKTKPSKALLGANARDSINSFFTAPYFLNRYILGFLSFCILVALLLLFLNPRRIHHPRIVATGLVLLLFLITTQVFNTKFLKESLLIELEGISTSE